MAWSVFKERRPGVNRIQTFLEKEGLPTFAGMTELLCFSPKNGNPIYYFNVTKRQTFRTVSLFPSQTIKINNHGSFLPPTPVTLGDFKVTLRDSKRPLRDVKGTIGDFKDSIAR